MNLHRNAAVMLAAAASALALGGAAHAAICGGSPPEGVEEFRGPVLAVMDGQHLCVALGADPSAWAPVTLADAVTLVSTAPPTRGALMAASFGQDVTCRILSRDAQGVTAECRTDAASVGVLAGSAAMRAAGRDWR